jgi:hypothetical protein
MIERQLASCRNANLGVFMSLSAVAGGGVPFPLACSSRNHELAKASFGSAETAWNMARSNWNHSAWIRVGPKPEWLFG